MIRAFAIMFVTVTLLANPAAARAPSGFGPHPGFVHPGFVAHPGFFPRRNFINNRFFFRGFFVGRPGIVVAPFLAYPYPPTPATRITHPIRFMWRLPDNRTGMGRSHRRLRAASVAPIGLSA
jgi:hypothetical protein